MKIHRFALAAAMLLTLLLSAGCGPSETPPVDPEVVRKELLGKVWICESLFGREVHGEAKLTLELLPDGTVKGNGGCNDFTGTYTLAGETLTFGPIMQNKQFCGAAAGEQEFSYFSFLGQVKTFKVDGDELELFDDTSGEPMSFSTGEGGFLW